MAFFAVTTMRGAAWEKERGIREQPQWAEHAEFADRLVEDGRIILGGPIEDADDQVVALIAIEAPDVDAVHEAFAADPWVRSGIPCAQGCPAVDDLASRRQGVDASRTTCREHRVQRRWASEGVPSEHRQGTDPSPAWDRPSRPAERSALYKCRSVPPRAQAKLGILRAHFGHAHRRLMSSLLGSSHLGGQSGHHQVVGVFDQVP